MQALEEVFEDSNAERLPFRKKIQRSVDAEWNYTLYLCLAAVTPLTRERGSVYPKCAAVCLCTG